MALGAAKGVEEQTAGFLGSALCVACGSSLEPFMYIEIVIFL
jgi:hypothetical protein